MPKILYILASRERPEKCIRVLDNIQSLSRNKDYQILVAADVNDSTMCNDEMRDKVKSFPNTKIHYGISTGKISAINRDVMLADEGWAILVNVSDDQIFTKEGFDIEIISDMEKYFPDTDGFLHYTDGSPSGKVIATMSIMGRKYFERFNYIYHPDYFSLWCDNEATDVAKKLNKYVFLEKDIAQHLHTIWGKAENDELYKRNSTRAIWDADEKTYHRRKKMNFGL